MNIIVLLQQINQAQFGKLSKHYKVKSLFVLLYTIALLIIPLAVHANYEKKTVLVIHSYHKGYLWTDDISNGIERVLSSSHMPLDVQYEYMDTKKTFDDIYLKQIVEFYRYKFLNRKFDVIITSDDNAFNFMQVYRDELFPGTPIIFCGANYMTPERMAKLPNCTGVNESISLKKNLELILHLHPKATSIIVIADATTTGTLVKHRLDKIKSEFKNRSKLVLWQDLSKEEIVNKLRNLPDTTIVLYTLFSRDRNGKFFEYDESINMVTSESSRPIYVTWDFSMGTGAVGGLLTNGISQGETAAQFALQFLRGTPIANIPFVQQSPNKYIFDYNVLKRFGIAPHLLPAKSIIRNQPDEFYKKYRELILKSIIGAVILILIIVMLSTNILRRRQAEALLTKANEKLEERVKQRTQDLALTNIELTDLNKELISSEERYHSLSDAAFEGIVLTEEGIVLEANNAICTMLLYKPSEIAGKEAIDLVPEEDRERIKKIILSGAEYSYESRCLRQDGSIFPIEVQAKMFAHKGRKVRVTAIRDLTDKKNAEEEIQALQGIIPICMHCKEIRDDKGYWNKLEKFISERSDAVFSHSICDICLEKYHPEDED